MFDGILIGEFSCYCLIDVNDVVCVLLGCSCLVLIGSVLVDWLVVSDV